MLEMPVIPGYRVERELGQGGMARVYLAHAERLGRQVALKVMLFSPEQDKSMAARFIKEAKTVANLVHSNIVSIYDVGEHQGVYYMAMEYLSHGNLRDKIEKREYAPEEAAAIIGKIAEALDHAHREGFVHRDIKPENILFRKDGNPVLADFGIAKALGAATKLTKTGMSIGTPHYMSPEQARGQAVDARSDLYSLGVVLYEMLAGKVPYDAEDSVAIAVKHIQEQVPRLDASLGQYQGLIDKLLAKSPGERFQSGGELARVLEGGDWDQVESPREAAPDAVAAVAVEKGGERSTRVMGEDELRAALRGKTERRSRVPFIIGGAVVAVIAAVVVGLYLSHLARQKEDRLAWETALRLDSEHSYQTYLQQYPKGNKMGMAQERMRELERKREEAERERREAERRRQEVERQRAEAEAAAAARMGEGIRLRSTYKTIGQEGAEAMAKRNNFYNVFSNPSGNFVHEYELKEINGDYVVVDHATKLMWHQSGSENQDGLDEGKAWLSELNKKRYAGYNDWRLPTLEEAASLVENSKKDHPPHVFVPDGKLYIDTIFSGKQYWIWTGDIEPSTFGEVPWLVAYYSGSYATLMSGSSVYVRPVRSMDAE